MKPVTKVTLCAAAVAVGLIALKSFNDDKEGSVSDIPVIAPLYYSGTQIKDNILDQFDTTIELGRDVAVFTIAGVTLDVFISDLPLDEEIKERVIKRLSDPFYSVALGHFLYVFYDQYGRAENEDQFRKFLLKNFSTEELRNWQDSMFRLDEDTTETAKKKQDSDIGTQPNGEEKPSGELAPSAEEVERFTNLALNDEFYAMLVSIYDELFNNDDWELAKSLPDHYHYLTHSQRDQETIDHIQPLLVHELSKYVGSLPAGEMRSAVEIVLEDAKPENKNKVNNKAQAVAITFIDFIRMNVLKAYRQYVQPTQRAEVFTSWMQEKLDSDPDELITYLESRQNRPRAVQIVVDGLSQGLMEGLTGSNNTPYLKQALKQDHALKSYQPQTATSSPDHKPQLNFLNQLVKEGEDDSKYLPFFKELYQKYGNGIASGGIATTPTISVRNLPIVKTGATVTGEGGTGIPNFHFVDRQHDRAYYFYGNDALQLETLTGKRGMQTMFDRLGYLKTMNCNAQYDWNAQVSYDALVNLGLGGAIRDFGEQRCLLDLQKRAKVEKTVTEKRRRLLTEIKAYRDLSNWRFMTKISQKGAIEDKLQELAALNEQAMPDYLLMYNPWPDHFAHFTGPFGDEIINPTGELNRLDFWLGQFTEAYQQAGINQQTLWGMAGDHGLSEIYYTLTPETLVFDALEKQGIKLKRLKISSDEGEGPKITNALNYGSNKGYDVVVASTAGGNYMMDFFNSERGWKVQPLYREMTQFVPQSGGKPVNMIHEIAYRMRESLEYLVVRESDCDTEHCATRIVGYQGDKLYHELITQKGDRVTYQLVDEKLDSNGNAIVKQGQPKLLGLDQENPYKNPLTAEQRQRKQTLMDICLSDTGCNAAQWRELTAMTAKPDSVMQLAHLYEIDRSGTVNLFPKDGFGYNTLVPGRHAGETFLEKDAFVGFWREGMNPKTRLGAVDNGSLAPTLFEYLTGEEVKVGTDGWGYPSLLKELRE